MTVEKSQKTLLFVAMAFPSFVREDVEILQKKYSVSVFHYRPSKKFFSNVYQQIRLLIWLLTHLRAHGVFVWFADYHAFLPILFARWKKIPSFLVLGGYDTTFIPELRYGVFSNPIRTGCARFGITHAQFLFPPTEALTKRVQIHVSRILGNIVPVPFGFDPDQWDCDTAKENLVLTVGLIDTLERVRIKGWDLFIESAKRLPNVQFMAIGISREIASLLEIPPNLILLPPLPRTALRKYYSRAKVYAQFSLSEGMPNTLCEAMLCECIPVGSPVGGIPEVIGKTGIVLQERSIEQAVQGIQRALKRSKKAGEKARARVLTQYPLHKREQTLLQWIRL